VSKEPFSVGVAQPHACGPRGSMNRLSKGDDVLPDQRSSPTKAENARKGLVHGRRALEHGWRDVIDREGPCADARPRGQGHERGEALVLVAVEHAYGADLDYVRVRAQPRGLEVVAHVARGQVAHIVLSRSHVAFVREFLVNRLWHVILVRAPDAIALV